MTAVEAGTKLRALLVEHDVADAELNIMGLRRTGYDVTTDVAGTVQEFVELLGLHQYDVILADFRLPGWTGMEALEFLKENKIDVPLILVTGTLGEERAVECIKSGAADFVLKQNLLRLQTAVPRAVEERRRLREAAQAETRARQAEAFERESAERFHQLAENTSEIFFIMDAQFRETLYVNPAYEGLWGRPVDTLYENPQSFVDSILPEDHPTVFGNIERTQRGERPGPIEFRVKRPDGSVRWVSSTAVPIRNDAGEVYRISGVARDITEKIETRQALEESIRRHQSLTEASFDGVVVSRDGVAVEVNRGIVRMFGFDSDRDFIGKSVLDFVAPEARDAAIHRLTNSIAGDFETTCIGKNGNRITVEVTSRILDIDGKAGRITAMRDVTARRQLEAQFRQAQKMEAVGRLAGGVAHDFNNLLTVILGNTELVLGDMAQADPRAADLMQVRDAAMRATALTRQLLAFSRQQVIEPRDVDVRGIVKGTKKMLDKLIGEDIEIVLTLGQEPCVAHIDPGQLEQVLMNLAVNSRDAMPTGGKIGISTSLIDLDDDQAMQLWPATPGRFAVLSVRDTGVGMSAETRSRIFEPFFTTKDQGKGTGLGLATVMGIVQQAGGFVIVDSEPGQGATFKVHLPLVVGATGHDPAALAETPAPRGTETILLVEDDLAVREIARRILSRSGYSVIEADGPVEALMTANGPGARFHLLLTDVVMPQMSGRVLAERFTEMHPNAKVLYMSGYTDDAVVRHGVLREGTPYLQKPFTFHVLASKVREVLDG